MIIDKSQLEIRKANLSDIPNITEIYNEAIENGVATFDTEVKSIENRIEWFDAHKENHPILVAILGGEVVAWASFSAWSERAAYNGTAEVSIYVHKDFRGFGIGSVLFENLVKSAESHGMHYLLSRITQGNETSIKLHLSNGFEIIGIMHEVGHKFGNYLDVTLMEKVINKQKD